MSSIKKNTKHPHEIIIVDNCSTEEIKNRIKKKFSKNIKIIFNNKDNWVKGFNLGINKISYKWDKIVLSDADIKFKKTKDDKCWLQHLNKEMDKHRVIGKLGIALNTEILQNNKILNKILLREKISKWKLYW